MRRTTYIAIALAILALGAGGYFVLKKDGSNANTETTNSNSTAVNTAPNPGLIFSVNPAKGIVAGGTKVTIAGEGFSGSPIVLFGEVEGKDVQVKSAKEILVTAPAGAKGKVDITLTNASGPTSSLQDGFTYE